VRSTRGHKALKLENRMKETSYECVGTRRKSFIMLACPLQALTDRERQEAIPDRSTMPVAGCG